MCGNGALITVGGMMSSAPFARRIIMTRYIIVALYVLCASVACGAGALVDYSVNGEPFEGYYISPNKQAPLILLIHDWDGLTEYEIKRAGMLSDLGYSVFAADLFGKGIRPTEVKDKKQHTGELYTDRKRMRALLNGALQAAKEQGGKVENALAVGYCFGGAAVLEYARSGADLKAFVTFHGGLVTPEGQDYSKTQGKLLIFHGSADSAVTIEDFAALVEELEHYTISHEMVTYSGAPHAFTVFGSQRYDEQADKKSWSRFIAFLKETL